MTSATVQLKVSETDGLVSGYQITNITAAGVLAVEEPGWHLLVGFTVLPQHQPLRPTQPPVEAQPSGVGPAKSEERLIDAEDLADALEAEAEYLAKGKDAFKSYDEYRAKRLGRGV